MKLKLHDKVIVISGKDRGKSGKIIRVNKKSGRVVVEKVNVRTKHVRKTTARAGEKIHFEAAISASNVMLLDPKENKPTRVGYRLLANGKKERFAKLSGESLDNLIETAAKSKSTKKIKAI